MAESSRPVPEEAARLCKDESMAEVSLGGDEKKMSGERRHTSARRSEARQPCGVWASDFMQPWPGAVENEVGVVPR